jgi:ABC-type multidrug transport system fused ATPase/permease subunit
VDIPDGLKHKILDEEEPEEGEMLTRASVLSSLQSEKLSLISEFEESDLIKEVRKTFEDLKLTPPSYDLRIVDGKYTVTNYSYDYITTAEGDDEAGHKRKKPHYDTVRSSSAISNWIKKFIYFLKTREKSSRKAKERVLLDGVNLKFDSGKLYLVLGAPGAGKSTLLRYIASTLRTDKDHVREGSVSLNGISSDDPSTYWTVSITSPWTLCGWVVYLIDVTCFHCRRTCVFTLIKLIVCIHT